MLSSPFLEDKSSSLFAIAMLCESLLYMASLISIFRVVHLIL